MPIRSLVGRLVLLSLSWLTLTLVGTHFLLANLFERKVQYDFERELRLQLETLTAFLAVDSRGRLYMTRRLSEPGFDQPYSGSYWQVAAADVRLRSASLVDFTLPYGLTTEDMPVRSHVSHGPTGRRLLVLERRVNLPDLDRPIFVSIANDTAEIGAEMREIEDVIRIAIVALGIGFLVLVILQVHVGLRPLRRLKAELADVRSGKASGLLGPFANEIQPVADELNLLIRQNAEIVERARTHVGNLAHALKTPLSVLMSKSQGDDSPLASLVRAQADAMNRHVSHHLARASAIGPSGSRFRQTELAPVIDDVVRTLKQIYVEKELNVEVEVPEDLQFQGERQDLIEIVGNIADNAFKWAAKRVRIGAEPREEGFLLSVDDDGPGLPATFQIDGFERGRRLDETVPGTGFGLAIVRDIVQLYGGDIALRRSRLGGMAVMLNLPAARALADFR